MVLMDVKKNQVIFVCGIKPDAKRVYLVGTFNNWQENDRRMTKVRDGSFRARLTLAPGHYEYKFLIDGEWTYDPDAPEVVTNRYGTRNSVVVVPEAAAACGPDCGCCCDE